MIINFIGLIASILFVICYIPQLIKLFVTKETKGISILVYWICFVAYLCSMTYTILTYGFDRILLTKDIFGLIFCVSTMTLYYKYKPYEIF